MSVIASHSPLNISETGGYRFGSKGPPNCLVIGNSLRGINGHVIDDVT